MQKLLTDPKFTETLAPQFMQAVLDEIRGTRADVQEVAKKIELLPGQFAALLDKLPNATRPELVAVADRFDIPQPEGMTDTALRRELEKRAEDWRALRREIAAIPETMKQLSNLKGAAQAAFDAGRFEEVEMLLERVHQVELEEAAKTAELRAETALLRGRVDQAFTLLSSAADSLRPIDPLEPARRRILQYFAILRNHGLRYGGSGIARGIDLLAPVLSDDLLQADAWLWGAGMNSQAIGYQELGSRTGGSEGAALLGQAVEAYRAALEVGTRADHPVDWAMMQNNLGNALSVQGERTGGPEGEKLLGQAVEACRAALEVLTRADHPVDWAMTLNNLGGALWAQGSRTGGPEGAALLGQAVDAYRAALEVRTRADHPVQWAITQNNLGAALRAQGSPTGGPEGAALLGQAVDAYRAALEVTTRADHPVDWAMTQNNLGNALSEQGSRTGGPKGTALLGQAVDAYRAAQEVYTRADHPVHWATTQNNLGAALREQGSRTGGPEGAARLGQAVEAYSKALEVRTRADHPVDWAMTQENLAEVYEALAQHDTCTDPAPHLRAALAHVEAALEVYDPEHMPYDHGTATALRDRIRAALAGGA